MGASAFVLHFFITADIVALFRVLPVQWLETMWVQGRTPSRSRLLEWAGVAFGSVFILVATALMAILLTGGGYMTAVAVAELVLAGAWLIYLLRRSTPRTEAV